MKTKTEKVIFTGGFNSGMGVYRDGTRVAIVPEFTHWDDDRVRLIVRDGEAILQKERRIYVVCLSCGTGEWTDIQSLGPAEGLTQSGYGEDGEDSIFVDSREPILA